MDKIFVFDTETTGLLDFKKPADDPAQPRLASLAIIKADLVYDTWQIVSETRTLVRPDGWVMPPDVAEKVHGLTQEVLERDGGPVGDALNLFEEAVNEGRVAVAHNAQYDAKLLRGENRRAGRDDLFERTPNICTMRAATAVCRIPSPRGRGFKFPKLAEAYRHLLGKDMAMAHDSLADARAAFEVFCALHKLGALPPAVVHYAADRLAQDREKLPIGTGESA